LPESDTKMKRRRVKASRRGRAPRVDTHTPDVPLEAAEANVWLCVCARKKDGQKQLRANDRSIARCEQCGTYRAQMDRAIRDMAQTEAGEGRIAVLGQPKLDDGWAYGQQVIVAVPDTPERFLGLLADEVAMLREEARRRGLRDTTVEDMLDAARSAGW